VLAYVGELAPDAAALGVSCGEPLWDDDRFEQKLAAVLSAAPALVSFTFGCPSAEAVASCHEVGSAVAVTVTSPEEARLAAGAGADALCVQGYEAGAHRGSFSVGGAPGGALGLVDLVREVSRVTDVPQIAAGGVARPHDLRAVLSTGAIAAQCGTAFLRCPESGAHPVHKAALSSGRYATTVVTRAFSGRPARALVNRFVLEHADAPSAYPEVNNATRPLRRAAAERGDAERMSLWAGVGFRFAADRSAGEIVEELCDGTRGSAR
ncbi:MAG: NAD(P)H-dependent flavin oxidoreductase, partial [Solirubrobacteraceae bacterium]